MPLSMRRLQHRWTPTVVCKFSSVRAKMATMVARITDAQIKLVTYNLLSPGYFRKLDRTAKKRMEASHPEAYMPRIVQQASALAETETDLVCLQEMWFKSRVFEILQRTFPDSDFGTIRAQRSGSKEDGVCLMYAKRTFECVGERIVQFEDEGDRCMALALLRLRAAARPSYIMAATTHLTYPHDEHDSILRVQQAHRCLLELCTFGAAMVGEGHLGVLDSPVLLSGDFNGCDDNACQVLSDNGGFVSCFKAVHGRHPGATHLDHAGASAPVDAVLLRHGLRDLLRAKKVPMPEELPASTDAEAPALRLYPCAAYLLPASASDDSALSRPVPQTRDTLEWLAQQGKSKEGQLPTSAVSFGRTDVPGHLTISGSAPILGPVCSLLSVPPIVDSPSERSSAVSANDGPLQRSATQVDAQSSSTRSSTQEGANVLITVCQSSQDTSRPDVGISTVSTAGGTAGGGVGVPVAASKAELGPWCSDPSLQRAPSMGNVLSESDYTGAFAITRPMSALSLTDWCNLSDHRPLCVTFNLDTQ